MAIGVKSSVMDVMNSCVSKLAHNCKMNETDRCMLVAYLSGEKISAIAEKHSLSGERIRQRISDAAMAVSEFVDEVEFVGREGYEERIASLERENERLKAEMTMTMIADGKKVNYDKRYLIKDVRTIPTFRKRTQGVLAAHNIRTIGELIKVPYSTFLAFDGLGMKCRSEVEGYLEKRGMWFLNK